MNELVYTVGGMHCGSCRLTVTEEVSEVPGVTHVEVDLDARRLVVRGESVDDAAVRAAVTDAGYRVEAP